MDEKTHTIIKLESGLDFEKLLGKAKKLLDKGYKGIILDFSGIESIRSSEAAVLIGVAGIARERGTGVAIAELNTAVLEIFEALGVHRIIKIYKTISEAKIKMFHGD